VGRLDEEKRKREKVAIASVVIDFGAAAAGPSAQHTHAAPGNGLYRHNQGRIGRRTSLDHRTVDPTLNYCSGFSYRRDKKFEFPRPWFLR